MPTISVVIATFHRPDALNNTIRDLLAQTILPLQIIVVDNSAAGSRYAPTAFSDGKGVECRYIEAAREGFVNAARNAGLKQVTADLAVMLDDDMKLPADLLANFLRIHDEGWDAVAGMVYEDGQPLSGRPQIGIPLWTLARHRHGTLRGHTIAVPSCLVSMRRTMLEQIDFLDEAFIYNYDDYDLGLRIWLNGFTLIQDPRAAAYHLKLPHGGSRQQLLGNKRTLNKFTAKYYFVRKHFGRQATAVEFLNDILRSAINNRWRLDRVGRNAWNYWKAFRLHTRYGQSGITP